MNRRKRASTVRIFVPSELQNLVGRRELWRSTQTENPKEARLRAALWEHHFGAPFLQLRKSGRTMAQDQLSALVAEYLEARLEEIEERLALDLPGRTEADRDVWRDPLAEQLDQKA